LLVLFAVILVYYPALSTYFSQDDFTHLVISKADSFKDVGQFFVPVDSGIFYRPLSVQIYTFISRSIFGLNPYGFHLIALSFHLGSVALVYLLLKKLTNNEAIAKIGALVYGVHPSHFMSLFWIAEFSMVLGPFLALGSMLAFFNKRYYWFWLVSS